MGGGGNPFGGGGGAQHFSFGNSGSDPREIFKMFFERKEDPFAALFGGGSGGGFPAGMRMHMGSGGGPVSIVWFGGNFVLGGSLFGGMQQQQRQHRDHWDLKVEQLYIFIV